MESDFRNVLKKELEQRMNRNPRYSLRAFAKDLKLPPPLLSDILNGKRGLSRNSATQIAKKLGMTSEETELFCDLVESRHARSRQGKEQAALRLRTKIKNGAILKFLTLDSEQFSVIADWYHFAILELVKTPNFKAESAWIAKRLGIPVHQAETAVARMESLGILGRDQTGLSAASANVHSPDGLSSKALKSHHEQMIGKALDALYTHPVEERDFRGLTIRCRKTDVPKVRERMRRLFQELDAELSADTKGDEVYQLSTQFFCLTRATN